jgi:hypothetical protein
VRSAAGDRWGALRSVGTAGGVVGPAAFVAAWATGALVDRDGPSPVHDAISRLAAVGADTRGLMTAGFTAFGLGVPVAAFALRRTLGAAASLSATVAGLATLAVAATPLDRSSSVDTWHAAAAGLGYVALAATPLLAARPLGRAGRSRLARAGIAAGTVSGVLLATSTVAGPTGLLQRTGLGVVDAWLVAMSASMLRSPVSPR